MNAELKDKIKNALRISWSADTCLIFQEKYPYYGQCAQTAIVIAELFGGEILKTSGWPHRPNSVHFYNRINGVRHDFTAEQFTDIPNYTHDLEYLDIQSNVCEAREITSDSEISAFRAAFTKAYSELSV
jgi:hypothetical protein